MTTGAQHRPGSGNHRPEGRCRNGHPIISDADLSAHKGELRCAVCLREARKRWRENRKQKPRLIAFCARCGRDKYLDLRTLCLTCRHETRGETSPQGAALEVAVDDACLLENAPHWVKADPAEHAAWIAAERAARRRRRGGA